jgi:hypothetical protein
MIVIILNEEWVHGNLASSWPGSSRPSMSELYCRKKLDARGIQREDAQSLSSGRALRGPVGAFARA